MSLVGFIIALIIIVGIICAVIYKKTVNEISNEEQMEVAKIAEKVNHHLKKINSVKTTSSKINNCEKALGLLNQASQLPQYRSVITNYDELVDRIPRIKKVLPVGKYLERAQKHNFKGKESSEKNSLLDALYEIRKNNITNQDFESAELHDDQTGEIITIELIENRLRDLGWDEESQISR